MLPILRCTFSSGRTSGGEKRRHSTNARGLRHPAGRPTRRIRALCASRPLASCVRQSPRFDAARSAADKSDDGREDLKVDTVAKPRGMRRCRGALLHPRAKSVPQAKQPIQGSREQPRGAQRDGRACLVRPEAPGIAPPAVAAVRRSVPVAAGKHAGLPHAPGGGARREGRRAWRVGRPELWQPRVQESWFGAPCRWRRRHAGRRTCAAALAHSVGVTGADGASSTVQSATRFAVISKF